MNSGAAENDRMNLIDEAICRAFELAWLEGTPQEIISCLPPESSASRLPTLIELICIRMEFEWKAVRSAQADTTVIGETHFAASPVIMVEDYLAIHAELQDDDVLTRLIRHEYQIREQFGLRPQIEEYVARFPQHHVANLLGDIEVTQAASYEPAAATALHQTIADPYLIDGYELLEQIGAGGMGLVYRARQLAADRTVALKLIRSDRLSSADPALREEVLERFRTEAQATAKLEHPNVVGIYDVNTSDPDCPWFSMQYVEGQTLNELLQDGPLSCRQSAEFCVQIVRGIAAAHGQQILHRDMKPQNVFVRAADRQLLVGDFGLAKLAVDDSQQTTDDAILGTPAYMSPEQVRDSAGVAEATDIWAVGATLYRMLTGRPPFQGATPMDTLRQVLDHEVTPPAKLNPQVDRDLDTICLKCLQKQPAQRYATADELLKDLQLYLEGRPIHARPVSRAEHTWRWCRRNPLPAAMIGTAFASLLTAVVALWVGYTTATEALEESDISHAMARQTVKDLLTEVNETVLLEKPGLQPLRQQLYEKALSYYRRFVQTGRDSREVRDESGDVWFRIGLLEQELGHAAEADEAFQTSLELLTRLQQEDPSLKRLQLISSVWNAWGALAVARRNWQDADARFIEAIQIRNKILKDVTMNGTTAERQEVQRLRANTIMNLGAVARNTERFDRALEMFSDAAELQSELMMEQSTASFLRRVRRGRAMALYNMSNAILDSRNEEKVALVRGYLVEAAELFEELCREVPDSYSYRHQLIWIQELLCEESESAEEALPLVERAVEGMEKLIQDNPAVPSLVDEWRQLKLAHARVLYRFEEDDRAMDAFAAIEQSVPVGEAAKHEVVCLAIAQRAVLAYDLMLPDADDLLRRAEATLKEFVAKSAHHSEIEDWLQVISNPGAASSGQE